MRTATAADVPAIRTLLSRAYAEDPLIRWVFPDPATREDATAAWLGVFAEPAVAGEQADVVDGDPGLAAVALWRGAGTSAPPAVRPTAGGLLSALVGAEHAAAVGAGLAATRPLVPDTPSAYLQFLAVDPSTQRRGLGRAVLAPGLARADAAGTGVHLETTSEQALAFYRVLGFSVTGVVDLPGGGPRLWALRRDAAGTASVHPATWRGA